MKRRRFLGAAIAAPLCGQTAEVRTHVYKKAAGCEIKADVIGPADSALKPVAVWIHGGALISGSRRLAPTSRVARALLDAGFRIVSIDYRLAPETKLPGIIEDLEDAFRWVRRSSSELRVDAAKLVACGGSAGGYLTLMSGFRVKPAPRALAPFWGYGDIVGAWYSKPDPFYLKQPAVSREEALAAVGTMPISEPPEKSNRGRFYLHCRQQGIWPREVGGRDPASEDRWFTPYSPIRNVTKRYPPTMLIHGTADTDVPYQQSVMMADRFKQAGVEHKLVTVDGGNHGIGNIAPEQQDRIYRDAAEFLARHVG